MVTQKMKVKQAVKIEDLKQVEIIEPVIAIPDIEIIISLVASK